LFYIFDGITVQIFFLFGSSCVILLACIKYTTEMDVVVSAL